MLLTTRTYAAFSATVPDRDPHTEHGVVELHIKLRATTRLGGVQQDVVSKERTNDYKSRTYSIKENACACYGCRPRAWGALLILSPGSKSIHHNTST